MTKCHSCGLSIAEGGHFCPACGVSVDELFGATKLFTDSPSHAQKRQSVTERGNAQTLRSAGSIDSIDDARFVPGTMLEDRYRIVGLLGKGGMGEVYRADDLKLSQPVALKFLPEALAMDGAALARFHREVRVARQVSHRNVCRVYDIGEMDGNVFLSMEFIRGEELASLLRRIGRLPADKALEIARQLCAGLAAAHDNGVLHRDLKPANIMIDAEGNVRITDFGLAGMAEELRRDSAIVGTPSYMSPEQLVGQELTVKSDIYSLGLVLYEIFTGKKAFEARSLNELLDQRKNTPMPESLSTLVKDVDPLVERVVERCLARDPERRPGSAIQVAAALPGGDPLAAALAAGETPSPEMVAAAPHVGAISSAKAITLLAAIIAGLAVIIGLSGRVLLNRRVPLDKSPEILKERASDIVRKLGYTDPPVDTFYRFFPNLDYERYVKETDQSSSRWDKLATGEPPVIFFRYRQSPHYMIPFNLLTVTADDPPPSTSGMAGMSLDTLGRLNYFYAVPPQREEPSGPSQAPDWSTLFSFADLDFSRFEPTESRWVPPHPYDTRAAWNGLLRDQSQIPIRVEAASYRGKPVYFEIVVPWDQPKRQVEPSPSLRENIAQVLALAMFAAILLGSGALARHNLRLGRGDRKGAFRLALFVLVVDMVSFIVLAHHVPTISAEFDLFIRSLSFSLFNMFMTWLIYMALEPFVRRRWPEWVISWNRFLAGGFRDPLVGRDIMLGMVFGLGAAIVLYIWNLAPGWFGLPPATPYITHNLNVMGFAGLVRSLSEQLILGLVETLGFLFILLLLTIVLRRTRLAMGVGWIILALCLSLGGHNPSIDWIFAGLAAALLIFALARFGLLAMMFTNFTLFLCLFYPMTSDFSVWYAWNTVFAVLLGVSLAVYAFHTSLAGQPLFRGFLQE